MHPPDDTASATRISAILPPIRRSRRSPATASKTARDVEDRELIRRAQQDRRVHAQAVESFMPLARSLARRYHRGEEPLEDLEQVAALGLLKAIRSYDPDRGFTFASFAVPTITGELRRHFRDKGWTVHVPRDLQELALAVKRHTEAMNTDLGRMPTAQELSDKLGRDVEDILEAREAMHAMRPDSLDRPHKLADDQDDTPIARLGDLDPGYERTEDAVTLGHLTRDLPERERLILALRFTAGLTQSEIGARLGISQMHVSRLLRRTISELHAMADKKGETS